MWHGAIFGIFIMLQTVTITAYTTELLTATSKGATSQTEPEVFCKITFSAMRKTRSGDMSRRELLKSESVLAGENFLLPSFHLRLAG